MMASTKKTKQKKKKSMTLNKPALASKKNKGKPKSQRNHQKQTTIKILNKKEYYEKLHRYEIENKVGKSLSLVFLITIILLSTALVVVNKTLQNVQKSKQKIEIKEKEVYTLDPNYVFLGDSITEYYPLEEFYEDLPVVKSGIAGYETQDILDRMDEMVYRYNPSKVFLLIGTNDFSKSMKEKSDEEVANNIYEIIEKIQEKRPLAKIYLESIYPTTLEYKERVINTNKLLKEYCEKHQITYIDLYEVLKKKDEDDEEFSKEYSDDGLHPNHRGYEVITETLMPYIKEKVSYQK